MTRLELEGTMKKVLVLEDDPSNMQAFSVVLGLFGYNVLEATTGKEAIEAPTLTFPDLPEPRWHWS